MNILIVGSGAREHAIAFALQRSSLKPRLFCCGTSHNPGILQMTHGYWSGEINNVEAVVNIAKEWRIGLAIIGPEAPLERGLADALWQAAIPTVGPKKRLAQIETSKAFARHLMKHYNVEGLPRYQIFHESKGIKEWLLELGEGKFVVKTNGLTGGKGVKVAGDHLKSIDEALLFSQEILQQQSCVIEEKLIGQEFSLMCFCDGETMVPMPIVQDHKRAFVNDQGPNTGGMGSYTDVDHSLPFLTANDVAAAQRINETILQALFAETSERYVGILYGSFIATSEGVFVIEFNARFGDPESLNVLTILQSDFVNICKSMVTGSLTSEQVVFANQATVCKYAVPEGYPDRPLRHTPIEICAVKNKSQLYLSAVDASDGKIFALGSRAAAYVGVSDSISAAEEIAEKEISGVSGRLFHREDIGTDQLIQKRVDQMRRLRSS